MLSGCSVPISATLCCTSSFRQVVPSGQPSPRNSTALPVSLLMAHHTRELMSVLLAITLLSCGKSELPPPPEAPSPGSTDSADGVDSGASVVDTDPATDETVDSGVEGKTGETGDPGDTAPAPPIALPDSCEQPEATIALPFTLLGDVLYTEDTPGEQVWFMELTEVAVDVERQWLWGAGQGGVIAFDISEPTPRRLGYFPAGDMPGRYYRVEVAGDRVYAANRDLGLTTLAIGEDASLTAVSEQRWSGIEGLELVGDRLYATGLWGDILTFDLADPDRPRVVHELGGLGTPWDLVAAGDVAYVADGALGVVTLDLSDPDAPAVVAVAEVGGAQEVALGEGVIYAAAGGGGVVVLDRSDPLELIEIARLSYGASVQSVSLDGDVLWATSQEDLIAVDVSDPRAPVPIGTVETPQFAMHVDAWGGRAYVGDWNYLEVWSVAADAPAPDLELEVAEILVREGEAQSFELTVRNTGGAALSLSGATLDDPRFSVGVGSDVLGPAEETILTLSFDGAAGAIDAALCLASDDPDLGQATVTLHSGGGGSNEAVGTPAPDFVLQGLDGETYQLSEELGHPVVLIYFATW